MLTGALMRSRKKKELEEELAVREQEAHAAVRSAAEALIASHDRDVRAEEIVHQARQIRERNHFAQRIALVYRGRP